MKRPSNFYTPFPMELIKSLEIMASPPRKNCTTVIFSASFFVYNRERNRKQDGKSIKSITCERNLSVSYRRMLISASTKNLQLSSEILSEQAFLKFSWKRSKNFAYSSRHLQNGWHCCLLFSPYVILKNIWRMID